MDLLERPAVFNGIFWDCPFDDVKKQVEGCKGSIQSMRYQKCIYKRDDATCDNIEMHQTITKDG